MVIVVIDLERDLYIYMYIYIYRQIERKMDRWIDNENLILLYLKLTLFQYKTHICIIMYRYSIHKDIHTLYIYIYIYTQMVSLTV